MRATKRHIVIPSATSKQQKILLSSSPEVDVKLSSTEERSLCDGLNGIYSVWFHVAAVVIILLASLIGTALPIMAKYVPSLRANPYYFSLGKTAATGVLLSVATIHLINEASEAFEEYCVPSFFKNYNAYSFLFALMAALMMQAIDLQLAVIAERWLKAKHENAQMLDKEFVPEHTPSQSLRTRFGVNTAMASTHASDVVIETASHEANSANNNNNNNNNNNVHDNIITHCNGIDDFDNNNKWDTITSKSSKKNVISSTYCNHNVSSLHSTNNTVDCGAGEGNKHREYAIREEMEQYILPINDNSPSTANIKLDNGTKINSNLEVLTLQDAIDLNEQCKNKKTTNTDGTTSRNKCNGHFTEQTSSMEEPEQKEEEHNNRKVEGVNDKNAINAEYTLNEISKEITSKNKPTAISELLQQHEQLGKVEESPVKSLHNYCSELECNTERKQHQHEENKEQCAMPDRLLHLKANSECNKSQQHNENHLQASTITEHSCHTNTTNSDQHHQHHQNNNDGRNRTNQSHTVSVEDQDNHSKVDVHVNESVYASHGHSHQIVIPPEEMNSIRRVIAAVCMEFGVTLHSIFVGLAVGFTTNDELKPLLVALIFHQMFEGMAMGSRLVDAQFYRALEITLAVVFATSAPLGIIIGIIAATISPSTMAGGGFVTMLAILDAFCGGILLYLAFNLLLFDFANDLRTFSADDVPQRRWKKTGLYVALWFGMLLMALVGKWL